MNAWGVRELDFTLSWINVVPSLLRLYSARFETCLQILAYRQARLGCVVSSSDVGKVPLPLVVWRWVGN